MPCQECLWETRISRPLVVAVLSLKGWVCRRSLLCRGPQEVANEADRLTKLPRLLACSRLESRANPARGICSTSFFCGLLCAFRKVAGEGGAIELWLPTDAALSGSVRWEWCGHRSARTVGLPAQIARRGSQSRCLCKRLRRSSFASALEYATWATRLAKGPSSQPPKAQMSSYNYDVSRIAQAQ